MKATVADVQIMAAELESDRVERKRRLSDPDAAREAICAFANDLPAHGTPGYLLIGVEDDGTPSRLNVTDELLRKLADMRSDGNILPMPVMSVERVELEAGVFIAVVEVLPAESPPVRLRGRVFVRVGPRRAVATPEEERRLTEKQVAAVRTFDEQPCRGTTIDDLDLDVFKRDYLPRAVAPEIIAQNQRTVEDQLASLRFLDPATEIPTNAGILVLGRDPAKASQGAYVQFVRFDGGDRAAPIRAQQRLTGNLIAQLRDLDRLLELWINVALLFPGGLQRVESPDYPRLALREATVNALIHRSYELGHAPIYVYWFSDRVEVLSPGGLYGHVTPENFTRQTSYRNPTLAEAAKALGYVERFGIGIARIRSEMKRNGNPEPRFEFSPTSVQVTAFPRPDPFARPSL